MKPKTNHGNNLKLETKVKKLFILFSLFVTGFLYGQLPPTAQALYNEMYNTDVIRGQYAVTNSVQTLATADGNSFYLKWFPAGSTPSTTALLVTLHGSDGNAFNEFYLWHQKAAAKGVGIIALQWYKGAATSPPNDYFDDPVLYTYIDTALKRIKYPSNKAFLHGFSRGSARSYAVSFLDVQPGGKNYFCTILSNAGKPDSAYTLYSQINAGTYGHTFYTGKKWAMFCGGQDPNVGQSGCQGMNMAKNWVQSNGGTVGLFISDPVAGHGGFHQTPAYIDSALNYYLPCFNGTSGLKELNQKSEIDIFPNPTHGIININLNGSNEKLNYEIYDMFGALVLKDSGNEINISKLSNSVFYIRIIETESGKPLGTKKIIKE